MMRELKGTQRLPRALFFRVDGTGTASLLEGSNDATLTDNGVGDYTLTWARPFLRVPVVVATPVTTAIHCEIAVVSVTAVQIKTFAVADGTTATDADFHLMVQGWDTADYT